MREVMGEVINMIYYDLFTQEKLSEYDLRKRKLPTDLHELKTHNIIPLVIEKVEYDPETQGVMTDGLPVPDVTADDPTGRYIQKMKIYPLLDNAKTVAKETTSAKRWHYETKGIILPDGTFVLTGIDDQNRISSALQGMQDAGINEVDFKSASGWTKVTLEQMKLIAAAIAVHVQACFTNERKLYEQIDAAKNLEELNKVDYESGWPSYSYPEPEDPTEPGEDGDQGTTDPEGKDPSENPGTEDKNPSTDDGTVTEPENPSDKNPSDKDPTGTDEDTEPKEIPDPEPTVDDVPKDSA